LNASHVNSPDLADFTFAVHIGEGGDRDQLHLDLSKIFRVCKVGHDWTGRLCFCFPEPFEHVIVHNGDHYPTGSEKLTQLILALNFFECHTAATA
jgi:hypothetical protein